MVLKTSAGAPITCVDWDNLADEDGFLALGRNRYSVTYVCYTDGTYFYAEDGETGVLEYGGPNSLGGASGTSAAQVLGGAIVTSATPGTVVIKEGVYPINTRTSFVISGKDGLTIEGVGDVIIRYTYPATALSVVLQLFSIEGACNNVTIRNITWDMNEATFTNAQRPLAAGLAWIGRVTGNSTNTLIEDCQFINAPDCGLVSGALDGWTIKNCSFDNIGEHCIYIDASVNVWIDNCRMLNFAKWIRGWGIKVASAAENVWVDGVYMEPNEDTLGYLDSLGIGDEPMILSVDGLCRNINFRNIKGVGDAAITVRPAFEVDNSYFVTIENLDVADWNHLRFTNTDATRYTSLLNSYIENMAIRGFPMMTNNCVLLDCPKYSTTEGQSDLTIKQTTWVRDDVTHNFHLLYLGRGGSTSSDIVLEDNKFFNWVYRIVDAAASIDTVIRDCYFSGGTSSWCINGAGTRVVIESNSFDSDITHGTATIDIQGGSVDILVTNRIDAALAENINIALVDRCHDNIGYVTENSGTTTIAAAATAIVTPHGCDYTPAASDIDVVLTNLPTNDIGDVYLSAIGAANFTVNCRNVPGVATAIFAWSVSRV